MPTGPKRPAVKFCNLFSSPLKVPVPSTKQSPAPPHTHATGFIFTKFRRIDRPIKSRSQKYFRPESPTDN